METSGGGLKKRPLVNELTQGRELANQLKHHLHNNSNKTISPETSDFLLQNILSSYEKALSMLQAHNNHAADSDSYPQPQHQHHTNKKRKTLEKWSEHVKVMSSGAIVEAPLSLSDGYSWRKYGQKDILGANHPRAYYRCTHRHVQGCLATKQVQRSDEDSSVFEITYRGRHTCIQATQISKQVPKKEEEEEEGKKCLNRVFSFKAYTGGNEEGGLFPSFLFASTPIETEKLENLFCLGYNLQTSDSSDLRNSTPNSPLIGDLDWDLDLD